MKRKENRKGSAQTMCSWEKRKKFKMGIYLKIIATKLTLKYFFQAKQSS